MGISSLMPSLDAWKQHKHKELQLVDNIPRGCGLTMNLLKVNRILNGWIIIRHKIGMDELDGERRLAHTAPADHHEPVLLLAEAVPPAGCGHGDTAEPSPAMQSCRPP
ncbi:hypothetical protein QTO34_000731 [Cnephaeus nilssonii]|uniref:Uncharacterized protein n=1 Tax=Cnephaeus nilssonii TaxID=3371016 RepID=A0AA40ICK0_CNENI|nr:hypothetical protein QTO34_000731 [Eptesicus nilssonii]